jgi:hypothetical protein
MRPRIIRELWSRSAWVAALGVLAFLGAGTSAQGFELRRHVASGGAVSAAGGSFQLKATAGESVVSAVVTGGNFSRGEGFWPGFGIDTTVDLPPDTEQSQPLVNALRQNMPNPFRGPTTIAFDIPTPSSVRLAVYDVTGRCINTIASGEYAAGRYRVDWNGTDDAGRSIADGVYFYRLDIGSWSQTKKMLKLR